MRVKNEGVRSEEVGRRISVRRREEEEEGNKGVKRREGVRRADLHPKG